MAYTKEPWVFDYTVVFNVDWSSGARELHYSFVHEIVTDNLVAAGATQGTATALAGGGRHRVVTVPVGTGVILPVTQNVSGLKFNVLNQGANALNIYPGVGHSITTVAGVNLGVNIPFVAAVGTNTQLVSLTATTWVEWP